MAVIIKREYEGQLYSQAMASADTTADTGLFDEAAAQMNSRLTLILRF